MFIYNLKLNTKKTAKTVFIILIIIVVTMLGFSIYKTLKKVVRVDDVVDHPNVAYITPNNYTNILREVYENPNEYIGQKICFTGYVYRLSDFNENQFVLARDMITSNSKRLIVGFLCESDRSKEFENEAWVEITGEIGKINLSTEIPIIKVLKIEKIEKPLEDTVPPPDNTYIPTSTLL